MGLKSSGVVEKLISIGVTAEVYQACVCFPVDEEDALSDLSADSDYVPSHASVYEESEVSFSEGSASVFTYDEFDDSHDDNFDLEDDVSNASIFSNDFTEGHVRNDGTQSGCRIGRYAHKVVLPKFTRHFNFAEWLKDLTTPKYLAIEDGEIPEPELLPGDDLYSDDAVSDITDFSMASSFDEVHTLSDDVSVTYGPPDPVGVLNKLLSFPFYRKHKRKLAWCDTSIIESFLEAKADPNHESSRPFSIGEDLPPMRLAVFASRHYGPLVNLLLDYKADPHWKDGDGENLLLYAAANPECPVVDMQALIKAGLDPASAADYDEQQNYPMLHNIPN